MRKATVLGITILVGGLAAPAFGEHGGIHPAFRAETAYFHCTGDTKVANVNNAAASVPTTWDGTAPTQSFQQGAGCGAVDPAVIFNTGVVDAYFSDTFTGNLRDMTIRLHNLLLSRARAAGPLTVKVASLQIDGQAYVTNRPVNVTTVVSSTGLTEYVEISITGLGSATDVLDEDGKIIDVITTGLATEDGNGEAEHQVSLLIDTDPNQTNSIWVWDATEVPSGIVFNPSTLAQAKIPATLPE